MNRTPTTTLRFRGYYGWIIVLVALVSTAFWIGIRTSFSVFFVALLEEFSWNRGDSAGAQSLALITYTVLAPLVGWLIDRFGPRRVIVPGILVLVMGLVMCATIKSLTQFFIHAVGWLPQEKLNFSTQVSHLFIQQNPYLTSFVKVLSKKIPMKRAPVHPVEGVWMGGVLKTQFDFNGTFS